MIPRYAIAILASPLVLCLSATAQDHLEPEDGILNATDTVWNYSRMIREVLLRGSARHHLARMVCLPAFEPEWVVTLVREEGDDFDAPHTYFVEYVGAEKKIFTKEDARDVGVKRSRAPLDGNTAEALNRAWRRMLRSTRYSDDDVGGLGADGVDYHFSRSVPLIDRGRNDPLAGWEQGQIWTPIEGSPCGEFVALGELLKRYAVAPPADRDKIREDIRAKADRLGSKNGRR